jgi:AcrR family transcriptional regulator
MMRWGEGPALVHINRSVYIATMPRDSSLTRAHIIQAADDLFYGEGIRSASMDAIAERAGVTKRTLYYHFRSKDDLITAYLVARDEPTLVRYEAWLDTTQGTLAEQIAGLFQKLAEVAKSAKWKGCGFLRAAAELASSPGHPALKVGSAHKKKFESWLAGRITGEGLDEAALRARQLMILLDGAVAQMLIHRDPLYALAAGKAASALLAKGSAQQERPASKLYRRSNSSR